jgi:small subunit ribosomal protein S3
MEAGALGAEIIIRGKLRTERARYEKFKDGYLPKSGNPALTNLREAVLHVQLKPGMYGIKVRIMPPGATFPDQIKMIETAQEPAPPEKPEAAKETQQPAQPEEPSEPAPETEATPTPKKPERKTETTPKETEPATPENTPKEAEQ